ncbi:DNA mismatch repair protein MutT [Halolactibacillus miurensis]|uniref:ADP-ribose pyrophosphatase YjhB, NUDIX family n=1 Tax=Halolactibacillus miurensis TaxID=306541 RepID=A0A1I6UBJ3_9BACI|nr:MULTISPECIES: NUDIX domain-containing protein [Halolactibacillus]GEM05535.1 DNA mismatch repair protein MutT [Halolactibacillus miurensis]SFS98657.1 ADP-ribose pyrophosphatase YjhB, NUDIX family [Halolactibacillus miurensis]
MDISFEVADKKFNYRVCAMMIHDGKILAMKDDRSPYYYLPGGRVKISETLESAVVREVEEECQVTPKMIRPLWLNQAFFQEDVDHLTYHEICLYYLVDISHANLMTKGEQFSLQEGNSQHQFRWLSFEELKEAYFYPLFLKEAIYDLPKVLTIRTERE